MRVDQLTEEDRETVEAWIQFAVDNLETSVVYAIKNVVTDRVYIGHAAHCGRRVLDHLSQITEEQIQDLTPNPPDDFSRSIKNYSSYRAMRRDLAKHGLSSFEIVVWDVPDERERKTREKLIIFRMRQRGDSHRLYNADQYPDEYAHWLRTGEIRVSLAKPKRCK